MKILRQFLIILAVTCVSELVKYLIPLPIPASVYGLVLMFLLLRTGAVKLPQVRETADFLIEVMPPMFIPAAVGLLEAWSTLRPILLPVLLIVVVAAVLTIGVSGRVAQFVLRRKERRHE